MNRSPLPDVFSLVLFRDGQISTVRLEVVHLDSSVCVVFNGEGGVDHAGNVVFPIWSERSDDCFKTIKIKFENVQHPRQGTVEIWIDVSNIVQRDWLAKEHLVKGQRESSIQVMAVKNGQAHDAPDKVEVGQVFLRICGQAVIIKMDQRGNKKKDEPD